VKTLLLATHNTGKVCEFEQMLEGLNIKIQSAADFNLAEPEETGKSFADNALLKARAACQATGLPSLADDSGLCVDILNGAPGIYSADWAEVSGRGQKGRDFNVAIERVHEEVGGIDGTQTARFMAVLALVYPDGTEELFEGRMEGHLTWPKRGAQGHGYDPIFIPEGHSVTCAEMQPEEKNAISHRAKAVIKFKEYLLQHV